MGLDERVKIGQEIRRRRIELQLTQGKLAEGICTHTSISEMERGTFILKGERLQQVCDKLKIHIEDLFNAGKREVKPEIVLVIIKIQIEREEFKAAYKFIEELWERTDLDVDQATELVLNKAECLIRMERADEAVVVLTEHLRAKEDQVTVDDRVLAQLNSKLGKACFYATNRNIPKAFAYYFRAYQLSLKFPVVDELSASIAFNLGKVCNWMRYSIDAVQYFEIASEFFEKVSDPKRMALIFFELGITYQELNKTELAKSYLEKSYTLYQSVKMMKMAQRVRQKIAVSVIAEQQPALAVRELLDCAKEFESFGDLVRVAYTYTRVAALLVEEQQFTEAKHYLSLASKLFEEDKQDPRLAYLYRIHAGYKLAIKDIDESVRLSIKSSELFDMMGMNRESAESLRVTINAYRAQGEVNKAFQVSDRIYELMSGSQQSTFQL